MPAGSPEKSRGKLKPPLKLFTVALQLGCKSDVLFEYTQNVITIRYKIMSISFSEFIKYDYLTTREVQYIFKIILRLSNRAKITIIEDDGLFLKKSQVYEAKFNLWCTDVSLK